LRIATIHELGNPDSQLVGTTESFVQTLVETGSTLFFFESFFVTRLKSSVDPRFIERFRYQSHDFSAPGSLELLLESSPWNLHLSSANEKWRQQ